MTRFSLFRVSFLTEGSHSKVCSNNTAIFQFLWTLYFVCIWHNGPQWARASSFRRFLYHTQRRTTVGRTPLDEGSAHRRDLYLTTHNTHNRQTSMPPVGFEPTISAASGHCDRRTLYFSWKYSLHTYIHTYIHTHIYLNLSYSNGRTDRNFATFAEVGKILTVACQIENWVNKNIDFRAFFRTLSYIHHTAIICMHILFQIRHRGQF
jgi:hypothetical protein